MSIDANRMKLLRSSTRRIQKKLKALVALGVITKYSYNGIAKGEPFGVNYTTLLYVVNGQLGKYRTPLSDDEIESQTYEKKMKHPKRCVILPTGQPPRAGEIAIERLLKGFLAKMETQIADTDTDKLYQLTSTDRSYFYAKPIKVAGGVTTLQLKSKRNCTYVAKGPTAEVCHSLLLDMFELESRHDKMYSQLQFSYNHIEECLEMMVDNGKPELFKDECPYVWYVTQTPRIDFLNRAFLASLPEGQE